MSAVSPENVLEQLKWRYAVKKFDATKKIPADLWSKLEEVLVLAPSSYGLQPWKFFVVTDPAIRAQLLPHTWGQAQVVDASHLVVFAVKLGVGAADAQKLVERSAVVRGVPVESLTPYRDLMTGSLTRMSPEKVDEWMTRQVFIAHGMFLAAAALLGVDACPMEGFMPEKYDEVLGLTAKGYRSVVLATVGYRSPDDKYALAPKVRYPLSDVVVRI